MCPRCGGPLTAAGNCANLCGGAYASVALLERPVPSNVLADWSAWRELERTASTPGPVYCSRCGAPNPAGAAFCVQCGGMLNP
jgi:hypothetical protein